MSKNTSLPIEYGENIIVKNIDEKIIISSKNTTKFKEGNFTIEGEEIIIESGVGIKISSKHPNILVISANLIRLEEKIYDIKKSTDDRLRVIEGAFTKILKQIKT